MDPQFLLKLEMLWRLAKPHSRQNSAAKAVDELVYFVQDYRDTLERIAGFESPMDESEARVMKSLAQIALRDGGKREGKSSVVRSTPPNHGR